MKEQIDYEKLYLEQKHQNAVLLIESARYIQKIGTLQEQLAEFLKQQLEQELNNKKEEKN